MKNLITIAGVLIWLSIVLLSSIGYGYQIFACTISAICVGIVLVCGRKIPVRKNEEVITQLPVDWRKGI